MPPATTELLPPKHIAVKGRPIRFRWLQQIIWSFLAANAGALIMVALYYLFVQLRWHVGGHGLCRCPAPSSRRFAADGLCAG